MNTPKITDLSWPLADHTPIYPGDPVPSVRTAATINREGYNLLALSLGTQTGSHIDAPYHVLPDGDTIDRIPLDYFYGRATLLNMNHKKSGEPITVSDLKPYEERIAGYRILLIRTDWYQKAATEQFTEHPYLSADAGAYLLAQGVRFLCMDTLNADKSGEAFFPVHDLFARHGCIIGENWRAFDKITRPEFMLYAIPLNIAAADGSPVRPVCVEEAD